MREHLKAAMMSELEDDHPLVEDAPALMFNCENMARQVLRQLRCYRQFNTKKSFMELLIESALSYTDLKDNLAKEYSDITYKKISKRSAPSSSQCESSQEVNDSGTTDNFASKASQGKGESNNGSVTVTGADRGDEVEETPRKRARTDQSEEGAENSPEGESVCGSSTKKHKKKKKSKKKKAKKHKSEAVVFTSHNATELNFNLPTNFEFDDDDDSDQEEQSLNGKKEEEEKERKPSADSLDFLKDDDEDDDGALAEQRKSDNSSADSDIAAYDPAAREEEKKKYIARLEAKLGATMTPSNSSSREVQEANEFAIRAQLMKQKLNEKRAKMLTTESDSINTTIEPTDRVLLLFMVEGNPVTKIKVKGEMPLQVPFEFLQKKFKLSDSFELYADDRRLNREAGASENFLTPNQLIMVKDSKEIALGLEKQNQRYMDRIRAVQRPSLSSEEQELINLGSKTSSAELEERYSSLSKNNEQKSTSQPKEQRCRIFVRGADKSQEKYDIGMDDKMDKLLKAYAKIKSVSPSKIILQFDGQKIRSNDTPRTLDMEDEDIVDATIK
eukprot:Nk52_evm25s234 gene=Nk52_evmTU25s234